MNVDDYRKGFIDGARVDDKNPTTTVYIMGYSFDKILELIQQDEVNKSINRLTPEEQAAREKFRQALDAVGHPEATCYSHWALEAYDIAFLPNFRK